MKKSLALAAALCLAGSGVAWAQASGMTEPQARSVLTSYGCGNISHLSMGPQGSWHGQCSKGGRTMDVMVDAQGKAGPSTAEMAHITSAHARSALMDFGCSNVSGLSRGPEGTWHGQCSKGGRTRDVMVDAQARRASGRRRITRKRTPDPR